MATNTNPEVKKQVNNLCAKIKSRYPHLYQETGGKLIRRTLLSLLEADAAGYEEAPTPSESSSGDEFIRTRSRVLKHTGVEQRAA
jgi:hypothetical protein